MSFTEILILAVIGLVVLGPEELPAMARKIARFLNELRKVKDEILGPMTDFHEGANKLLGEGREELHKNLSDLMNLRTKLDQQIADITKPTPKAEMPQAPASVEAGGSTGAPQFPSAPKSQGEEQKYTPPPGHEPVVPVFNSNDKTIDLSAPLEKASEKKPDGHS